MGFQEKPWLSYLDESVFIGNNNSFYLVSMPALAENHLKISINSQSIITQILKKVILHAFHMSEGLIRLEVDGHSFNKGEIIQLSIESIEGIDFEDISVKAVNGIDTLQLECTEEGWNERIHCSTALLIPGKYSIYAKGSLPSGEQIYSNKNQLWYKL